ncbi:MAG: SDR family oxidoreductase [Bacteroidales bacterium]
MNILITGAGKGLGLELVKKFSEEPGNKIIALSRNLDNLNNLVSVSRYGTLSFSEIIPYSFDLVKGDYQELLSFISMHTDHLDIVVNNAGYLINKPFRELTPEDFDTSFETNIKAVFKTIQALYPLLLKYSHVLNISSMSGFQGSVKFPGLSVYSASKAALIGLTQCLASECIEDGISFNALALGSVQTEMLAQAFPGYQAPLSAAQMSEFVVDFAKNGHKYFNGQVLPVALSTP